MEVEEEGGGGGGGGRRKEGGGRREESSSKQHTNFKKKNPKKKEQGKTGSNMLTYAYTHAELTLVFPDCSTSSASFSLASVRARIIDRWLYMPRWTLYISIFSSVSLQTPAGM